MYNMQRTNIPMINLFAHSTNTKIIMIWLTEACAYKYHFFLLTPCSSSGYCGDGYRWYLTILYSCMLKLYIIVYNRNDKPLWEHLSQRKKLSALSWWLDICYQKQAYSWFILHDLMSIKVSKPDNFTLQTNTIILFIQTGILIYNNSLLNKSDP